MNKILKWVGIVVATPLVLFFFMAVLIYLPPIQNFLVHRATEIASEELGMKVSIERVHLSFPLDLAMEKFVAVQENDTLLKVSELTAEFELMPLFSSKVNIDGLDLKDAQVNTLDFIDAVKIKGKIPHFYLNSHGINLKPETVQINDALLENADLCIAVNDSVPEDSLPSETSPWKVWLEKAQIRNSNLKLLVDSMNISLGIGEAKIRQTTMDLKENLYKVAHADFKYSKARIHLVPGKPSQGLDYSHLSFDSLNFSADSITSQGSYLALNILDGQFKERCGLQVNSLRGQVTMDSTSIQVSDLDFRTPYSKANLNAHVDWTSLDPAGDGRMNVRLNASVGRKDILCTLGEDLSKEVSSFYPDVSILAGLNVHGNMKKLEISDSKVSLDGVINLTANGALYSAMDESRRSGEMKFIARVGNVRSFLKKIALQEYAIPKGTVAAGVLNFKGHRYGFHGNITEGKGKVDLKALYDTKADHYEADLKAQNVNIRHFMPKDSLFLFTGTLTAQGMGTDLFSKKTKLDVKADVSQFQYKKYDINAMSFDARLTQNQLEAHAESNNECLKFVVDAMGLLRKDSIGGKISGDIQKADLLGLGLMDKKNDLSLHLDLIGGYDFKNDVTAQTEISNINLGTEKKSYHLKDLAAQLLLTKDTISARLTAGDLLADVRTHGGFRNIVKQGNEFLKVLKAEQKEKKLQYQSLKTYLPETRIELTSGNDNPICNFLKFQGYEYKQLHALFETSLSEGLKGNLHLYALKTDSIQLDTIRLSVYPQEDRLLFNAQVRNNRKNPQFVFNALLSGSFMEDGAAARLQYYDQDNVQGIDMGIRAQLEQNGYRFTFKPDRPLIAYHTFNLSPGDAYIFLRDDMQVSGNMSLLTDDGMGIVFKADPDTDEQQCMNMDLYKINLEEISNVIPYMPRMTGFLNGKIHAHQQMEGLMRADGQLNFTDLTYENSPMGDLDLSLNYEPSGEDEHTVSMTLDRNGQLVSQFSGTYVGSTGAILLDAQLIRFPAEIVNGFIPDHMFGFKGILEGKFKLTGDADHPIINGSVGTDSVYLFSDMYNLNLRVQDKDFPIEDSKFTMKDFTLYSEKNDELTANGVINFADLDKIHVNMSLRARDFQLIDRPRNRISQLYGKAYMNLQTKVNGVLDDLKVRGTLELLGNTDVTYVLKDTPITVEDRLNDLVTFMEFSDTTHVQQEVAPKKLSGVDLQLNLNISEGARINCDLSENRESYVELQGGGDLIFKYTPEGEMLLNGRYNINGGEMKYDLQVIPLKTFTLANGSYVQFNGDIMNPILDITATEQTRASVSSEGSSPRNVLFEVGVKISQTLQDMGLEFTIAALQDMTVQNQLASFSKETRGKLAVTMLATGLYLVEDNASGNVSLNNALNSFLQSEISNIAGNALKSIDLSFGMEDGTASDGSSTTDYSFRFAKRFWGNRVSIVIGGKVSAGSNANASDSFIDDVSIEYRLDDSGTRYVKLFHEKSFDSLLDGEITETGGGVVLRKKMTRFGELFIFRSRKKREAIQEEREHRREQREQQQKERNENE